MNLIFVGAEVGPWSKTGGLGDVLGGLPPAMAVSTYHIIESLKLFVPREHLKYNKAYDNM